MWSEFAACARTEWSTLPWSDDSSKRDVERMRWVCAHVCPSRVGCERDVEDDLADGRVVAGFRAGVSVRARSRRLAADQEEGTTDSNGRQTNDPGSPELS